MAYVNPTFVNGSVPPIDADNLNDLADAVELLPVENGGTGLATLPSGGILVGNGTNNVRTMTGTGAVYATASGSPQFGTLPVSCGGTGANTAAQARANLGLTKAGFVVQATAPSDTNVLWINTTDGTINYYNNSTWNKVNGVFAAN